MLIVLAFLVLLAAMLAAMAAAFLVPYRRDLAAARARVLSRSTTIRTAFGPIEYAICGDGTPVLVLHGAGGGWDQGVYAARDLIPRGYRLIAPSRFGYLRTPIPSGATPALEADALAAFLDALGVDRVPVVAFSAGSAPAFQLALRHPERVSRLVFFVPGAGGVFTDSPPGPPPWLMNVVLRWDLPMWLAERALPGPMARLVGVPSALLASLAPRDRVSLETMVELMLPVSARRNGLLYDAHNHGGAEGVYPLERIAAPSLFVTAADDVYHSLGVARRATLLVPDARLIEYPTGGHLLLGHDHDVWPRVDEFLHGGHPLAEAVEEGVLAGAR